MEPNTATQTDPLTEAALRSLKEIAVPEPVSWMPQTWGWALVAALLALAMVAWLFHRVRRYRANAYRREALVLLTGIEQKLTVPATHDQALRELAVVLKRVALAGFGRADIAALSGETWTRFLEEHCDEEVGHALDALLDDCEYQNGSITGTLAADDIMSATRTWIRRHHVPA